MLPGLAHSHSAGEARLHKLIVRLLSPYADGETERPPPNSLTLTIGRGQRERERERETEREREITVRLAGWWSLSVSFYR